MCRVLELQGYIESLEEVQKQEAYMLRNVSMSETDCIFFHARDREIRHAKRQLSKLWRKLKV